MARKEANTEVNELDGLDDSFDVAQIEQDNVAMVPASGGGAVVLGSMGGEEDVQLKLPYVSLVYGVSKIIDQFDAGDFVLDKTTLLAHKNESAKFIVLQTTNYWKEWFTQDQRAMAQAENRYERQFATREEVAAAGGTCPLPGTGAWPNGERPTFSQAMKLDILVRKPAGLVSAMFGVRLGEFDYAPACWIVDKMTYKRVAPIVAGASKMALKHRGLSSGVFESVVKMTQVGKNTMPVPNVRLVENLSDEELAQLTGYFG